MSRIAAAAAFSLSLTIALAGQEQATAMFRNAHGTFELQLPAGWRQLAPNEARRIAELPGAPTELGYVEPRQFYAVGPVEAWLRGEFDGPWLWVVEQHNEWQLEGDVATRLAQMWQEKGGAAGVRYQLDDVQQVPVGAQARPAITAVRTATPPPPAPASKSLDVHAPSGGQQISLSFICRAETFDRWQPEFRRWLGTLSFAREARAERTVGDRLWTPLLTGAVVALVLLALYKHTHRRG